MGQFEGTENATNVGAIEELAYYVAELRHASEDCKVLRLLLRSGQCDVAIESVSVAIGQVAPSRTVPVALDDLGVPPAKLCELLYGARCRDMSVLAAKTAELAKAVADHLVLAQQTQAESLLDQMADECEASDDPGQLRIRTTLAAGDLAQGRVPDPAQDQNQG